MAADTETTMSPADVLATLDELNSTVDGEFRGANERDLTGTGLLERGPRARTAVAALIEREAALESKLEGARIACANLTASLSRAEAERAALAERVKALEADADAFQWLERHVAAWHSSEASLPRVVVDPLFADIDGGTATMLVTGRDGVGTASLRTMVRMIREREARNG